MNVDESSEKPRTKGKRSILVGFSKRVTKRVASFLMMILTRNSKEGPFFMYDENSVSALFAELGSSPASMEAAKIVDAFGSQPGYRKAQANAKQAYIQALFKGVPTWLRPDGLAIGASKALTPSFDSF